MREFNVTIHGKVQGVGFRAKTKQRADEIGGIYGYVKNSEDGTVEVTAQGEEEKLQELLSYLKDGPMFAEVTDIDIAWHDTLQDAMTTFTTER